MALSAKAIPLALAFSLASAVGGKAQALPGDVPLMQRLVKTNPCPVSVPVGWRAADSTLGSGLRCSLVAAAAAMIRRMPRSTGKRAIDPNQVVCVQIVPFDIRDARTNELVDPYWSVEFYSTGQPWARAVIHRETGKIDAALLRDEFGGGIARACARAP